MRPSAQRPSSCCLPSCSRATHSIAGHTLLRQNQPRSHPCALEPALRCATPWRRKTTVLQLGNLFFLNVTYGHQCLHVRLTWRGCTRSPKGYRHVPLLCLRVLGLAHLIECFAKMA